jgi:hypothetical protein
VVHRNLADTADKFLAAIWINVTLQNRRRSCRAPSRDVYFISLRLARAVVDRAGRVLRPQARGVATMTKHHEKRRGDEGDRFHCAASHSYQL